MPLVMATDKGGAGPEQSAGLAKLPAGPMKIESENTGPE